MSVRRFAKNELRSIDTGRSTDAACVSMQVKVHEKLENLARMGLREGADAHADGVSLFYIDDADGDHIVEKKPDGTRVLLPLHSASASQADNAE